MRLQPNFSWQKYEGTPEDQQEQFQYQLQTQFLRVSNAVNATINDCSYFSLERPTAFTWIDGTQIYTKTITGTITTAPGTTQIPHGITGINQVVELKGIVQDTIPMTTYALILPFLDLAVFNNSIDIYIDSTYLNIITLSNVRLNNFIQVEATYTKVRGS